MMENIQKSKRKNWKYLTKMLGSQWNLGKRQSEAQGDICAKIYLYGILCVTDELIELKKGNKIVGFAGYGNYRKNKKRLKKKILEMIKNHLMKSKKIKIKSALDDYYKEYSYLPKELENYFDGELTILIVDEHMRSKQIGSKLFEKICDLAKRSGIKKLRIDTDDCCGVGFYEKNNCVLKFTTTLYKGEPHSEKAYIFEKTLA